MTWWDLIVETAKHSTKEVEAQFYLSPETHFRNERKTRSKLTRRRTSNVMTSRSLWICLLPLGAILTAILVKGGRLHQENTPWERPAASVRLLIVDAQMALYCRVMVSPVQVSTNSTDTHADLGPYSHALHFFDPCNWILLKLVHCFVYKDIAFGVIHF